MRDEVTALSFDSAVMTFGVWVDNRLLERDDHGRVKHTLDDLLADPSELGGTGMNQAAQEFFAMLMAGRMN